MKDCDPTQVGQFFRYDLSRGVIVSWNGQCVDDFDFGLNGSVVQTFPCNDGGNQQWTQDANNEFHGWGGECIEVEPTCAHCGTRALFMKPCNGDVTDEKFVQPITFGTGPGQGYVPFTIAPYAPASPNLVLGVPEGQENTRLAPVQIQNLGQDTSTRLAQTWSYNPHTREIHLSASVGDGAGMCLDVAGGEKEDGKSWLMIWPCYGGPSQQWVQVGTQWLNQNSQKCLDVPGWSLTPGDQVWTWSCWGGLNQQWNGPHS